MVRDPDYKYMLQLQFLLCHLSQRESGNLTPSMRIRASSFEQACQASNSWPAVLGKHSLASQLTAATWQYSGALGQEKVCK